MDKGNIKIVRQAATEFQQVVMGEVLVPDIPNVFGDIYSREGIVEFVHEFARQGHGIDIQHDQVDVTGTKAYIVESFIARAGDPDFIEGSWVVGMKIPDPETWQQVLDGEINGYSFEAECAIFPVVIQNLRNRQIVGVTEPDPRDGHTHDFVAIVDVFNRPIEASTGVTDGHSHKILFHTSTEFADNSAGLSHLHRYQVIVDDEEE